MPQAVIFLATVASSYAGTTALATAIFYGVVGAAYVGITAGISLIQAALTPKPSQPGPEDVQQSFRQNAQPRTRHYGRVKSSGPWLFGATDAGAFHKVIALAHGEIDAIEEFWIDDASVEIDGSGFVTTDPFNSKAKIQYTLGEASETAYSDLVSTFTEYTTAHRGDGIATLYAKQLPLGQAEYYDLFPNGINTLYRVVLRGAKIWNPKTEATEWDDNAASVIRDFMTSADGMRLPESIFTTPVAQQGWEDAFDVADDEMTLKAGGTEEQFRLWGSYTLQERPGDVVGRMLACCDARLAPTSDGGVTLKIQTGEAPTVTLTEDDILDVTELTRGLDREQRPNTIRAQFYDPDADYASGDADPWVDAADVTARGSEPLDASFMMAPSHSQCRRLMKRLYYRQNPEWVMRISTNMGGLACVGEDAVTIQLADFGIDDRFEIQNLEFNFGEGGIIEGVTLDVIAMPSSAYEWTAASEEGTKPVTTSVDESSTIPVPTGLTLTYTASTAILEIDADAPPSDSLTLLYRIKPTSSSDWITLGPPLGATQAQVYGPTDGVEYEVQAQHLSSTSRESEWTASATITITSDETAPGDVTLNSSSGGSGQAVLNFTAPNDANFNRVVIKRGTTATEGSASEVSGSPIYLSQNATYEFTDTGLAADDYYYWIYAQNGSGVDDGSGVATGALTVT